ncbi:apolipoprotein N-acyltransferase [Parathalassolituus penaei]|uniref:Apolipoprotein N-acyltransferase n=1 Tax=Parathalassolituus penaei TaxID=2997323 RepID=A0A9X3EEA0_9GAMM|nr:apolipoprotein N-acyltransferase [Parathalassolituus penaei]MCY0966002.1 apolipoprotein N-acyltransferase [Parathalassolituus penaei]
MRSPWFARSLLLTAGALFPLATAPLYWWPVGLVSIAIYCIAMRSVHTVPQAFWRTWAYQFGLFGVGVSWVYVSIHDFGDTSMLLSGLVAMVFAGGLALVPAMVFALRQKLIGQQYAWLSLPVFWFLSEWTRSWFLTGFPWLYAGDAHLYSWLSGWAPVIGSFGISFILVLTCSSLLEFAHKRRIRYLLVLLLWPSGWYLQSQQWTHPVGELKVAAVQGNVTQDMKWDDSMVGPTINLYFGETGKLWGNDLILWPETAITLSYHRFQPYLEELSTIARSHNATVITGIPYKYPEGHELAGEWHNSITATGIGSGLYHKQKLVPFGEFVPLEHWLRGALPFMDLEMSGFLAGPADQKLLQLEKDERLVLIAPFICYEIAYPLLVADMARQADMLVTISNDAWFGDSLGPKQHLGLAQMRALETGRYLLRSTNTGITALVDNKGHIIDQLPVNTRANLSGTAVLREGETPFMIAGVWPLLVLSGLLILMAIPAHYRDQKRRQGDFY